MMRTVKIALAGLGARGQSLLADAILPACEDYNVEVAAVFDPYADRTAKGAYFGNGNMVFEDSLHQEFEWEEEKLWNNGNEYLEKYAHPLWKDYDPKGGHGGMDYLVISAYLESLTTGSAPPIDVYDAAAYMSITALSEESILKGGAPVAIPVFTRGKWYMPKEVPNSKYKLTR